MPPRPFRNTLGEDHAQRKLARRSDVSSHRAGWAVRHTLIVVAALSLLAVGLHWWRTRSQPSTTTVPPAMRLRSNSGMIASLVFSPTGDELYVAAGEVVEVYDPPTGRKIRSWASGLDWITHFALSADGRVAMTAGDQFTAGAMGGAITLWSLSESADTPPAIATITTSGSYPSASALSPDGNYFAYALQSRGSVTAPNAIRVFDVSAESEKFACTGHTSTVNSLNFSPDGNVLVSAAWDGMVLKWDMETGQRATSGQASDFQMCGELVTYAPDGSRVAIGSGKGFGVCESATGSFLAPGGIQAENVQAIAFSPDGTLLAAAGNTYSGSTSFFGSLFGGKTEGTAGLWEAATGKLLVLLQENGPGIHALCFSPDGKRIAIGDENGVISIWNVDEVLRYERP